MYVTQGEKNKIESDRVKLSDLEEQIKQLTAYKAGIEMQAKEKSLNDAKDALTSDQVKNIKDQFEAKTPEEIEKEIAFAIYTSHKERDHPHSHGEYFLENTVHSITTGSPPLAWGILHRQGVGRCFVRITPTRMGNT